MSNVKSMWWMVVLAVSGAVTAAGCGQSAGDGNPDSGMPMGDGGTQVLPDGNVVPVAACGNGTLDDGEPCDAALLGGATCESEGFSSGTLGCMPDCRAFYFGDCVAAPVSETHTESVAIPDDGYDGTIASMACVDIVVPAGTRGYVGSEALSVSLGITHSFVGDLVVKLVAPSGHIATLMHRPGLAAADDGLLSGGYPANVSADHPFTLGRGIGGFISEEVGKDLTTSQTVCVDNIYCRFVATTAVGPQELDREPVAGTWRVCVGDAALGDTGSIASVQLDLAPTVAPEGPVEGGEVLVPAIPDGAFDGTEASMACRPFALTALPASFTIESIRAQFAIEHPNVGDLVFALVDPDGELHALGVRPGVAESSDGSAAGVGAVANVAPSPRIQILTGDPLAPSTTTEQMGEGLATDALLCDMGALCAYQSDPGALSWAPVTDLLGQPAAGTYKLCVGDAREGDSGTFSYGVLSFNLEP